MNDVLGLGCFQRISENKWNGVISRAVLEIIISNKFCIVESFSV